MKILLSAYACEPLKGSEPNAGWNWAYELSSRGNEVYVVTRSNNKVNITNYLQKEKTLPKINFFYYDLPSFFIYIKKKFKCTNLYYFLWQLYILKKCKQLNDQIKFDVIHHVTFAGLRHYSLLGELNENTIIGPLGGAETSPLWLRKHIGFKGAIYEFFRDLINSTLLIDPFFLRSIKKSNKLIFTTKAGIKYCPEIEKRKVYICPTIGLRKEEYPPKRVSVENQKRILFAGRHLTWKGMKIGIEAFNIALKKDPNLKLTIVGSGNESEYWKKLVNIYKINSSVNWIPWLSKSDFENILQENGVFIFPSLHDSGGFVVLDALKHGIPVICFDLGGPADTVSNSSGIIIKTVNKDYKLLLKNFSKAINELSSNKKKWEIFSIGAQKRAFEYSMNKIVDRIYK